MTIKETTMMFSRFKRNFGKNNFIKFHDTNSSWLPIDELKSRSYSCPVNYAFVDNLALFCLKKILSKFEASSAKIPSTISGR